jgi:dynein heavy chain 1, cytosolic
LKSAYLTVEIRLAEAASYVDRWLQFQSLWDLQSDQVYSALGDDLTNWLQILSEIRKSRATFDTSEVSRSFGVIAIKFDQVQSRVNDKYDSWQRDVIQRFANVLWLSMRDLSSELNRARTELERQSLEASSTAQAVSFITVVQKTEQKTKVWAPLVDIFGKSQVTLSRERFQFPPDWLEMDQIKGEWDALRDILDRKSKQVQEKIGTFTSFTSCSETNRQIFCVPTFSKKIVLSPRKSLVLSRTGIRRNQLLEILHRKKL